MSVNESPLPAPSPSECDVCHAALDILAEYATLTIVADATPRRLRDARGGGFLEEEWSIVVCTTCHAAFRAWLFRDGSDPSELDTLPPPPLLPSLPAQAALPSSVPPSAPPSERDEMEPLERPAPNRS